TGVNDGPVGGGAMHNTPHLTAGHEPELARQISRTVPGMAHWAGSGPFGATCRECAAYGYWPHIRNEAGAIVTTKFRKKSCRKLHELTGKHGPTIPERTEACRHFQRRNNDDGVRHSPAR